MYAQLYSGPPPASSLVEGIPPALDAVIARGMAKDPDDRFPTAGALAAAAREALLAEAPTPPMTELPTRPPGPQCRFRHRGRRGRPRCRRPAAGAAPTPPGPGCRSQRGEPRRSRARPLTARRKRWSRPALPTGAAPGHRRTCRRARVPIQAAVACRPAKRPAGRAAAFLAPSWRAAPGRRRGRGGSDRDRPHGFRQAAHKLPVDDGRTRPELCQQRARPLRHAHGRRRTVPVGSSPSYVQVAPNGKFAYIANPVQARSPCSTRPLTWCPGRSRSPRGRPSSSRSRRTAGPPTSAFTTRATGGAPHRVHRHRYQQGDIHRAGGQHHPGPVDDQPGRAVPLRAEPQHGDDRHQRERHRRDRHGEPGS